MKREKQGKHLAIQDLWETAQFVTPVTMLALSI